MVHNNMNRLRTCAPLRLIHPPARETTHDDPTVPGVDDSRRSKDQGGAVSQSLSRVTRQANHRKSNPSRPFDEKLVPDSANIVL